MGEKESHRNALCSVRMAQLASLLLSCLASVALSDVSYRRCVGKEKGYEIKGYESILRRSCSH
jgi:hypothetical protein